MPLRHIAVLSPGDMGAGVGWALVEQGYDVLTCLAGRGAETRGRAEKAGVRDVPDLDAVVTEAELVLSIMPPEIAPAAAKDVAAAMARTGKIPGYADCNAISPDTSRAIQRVIEGAGARYIDGGIIGHAPGKSDKPVRIYVSGPHAGMMTEFDGALIAIRPCGPTIGDASAVKMCYASVTKGTNTLHTAALITAEVLGVGELVQKEFEYSSPAVYQRMRSVIPRLPVDAARWVGEMEEISRTYQSAGVTPRFHEGAADIFRLLAQTPIAAESRDTLDPNLTLEDVLAMFVAVLRAREAAE